MKAQDLMAHCEKMAGHCDGHADDHEVLASEHDDGTKLHKAHMRMATREREKAGQYRDLHKAFKDHIETNADAFGSHDFRGASEGDLAKRLLNLENTIRPDGVRGPGASEADPNRPKLIKRPGAPSDEELERVEVPANLAHMIGTE
jgi:hypothetical protein